MQNRRIFRLCCLGVVALAAPALAHENHSLPPLLQQAERVDCTLEDGSASTCYKITTGYKPERLEIGPFCPATLEEEGGIWDWDGEKAGLHRLDGAFFEMLASQGYRFYDETGAIAISNPGSGARPGQDHTCLMAIPDDSVTITMLVPVSPTLAQEPTALGTVAKVGVALDGVPIFADAPSVLHTGHLPALDLCGGHIDPGGWYHWHGAATDIQTAFDTEGVAANCALPQNSSAQFGLAFDGFAIFGSKEPDGSTPTGLDDCQGHRDENGVYHYHASEDFPNLPPCLSGVVARDNFATTAQTGIGAPGFGQERGTPPGFDEAAETLGVDAHVLFEALRGAGGPNADLSAVAQSLGIDVDALRAALPRRP